MKKIKLLLFLFFSCITTGAFAQQRTIEGKVVDTLNKETLEYATITVINASDSILLGFARSDRDGKFSLTVPEKDRYILLITCPGFADYLDVVSKGTAAVIPMGDVNLLTRERVLNEVLVLQQKGAILIKGDTTEYVADSFKVDANANVEDLLKRLPGLQVDKNGQITAQGEKVQKILVDGEEFFSDDPAVVNRNLQAKTIDKVQVFDKKSESAEFTGIDDGQRIKTINLKMKDKYKQGYFGKLALSGGNDGFFENQGMINFFRGKQKLSVYGTMANTGRVGLSFDDQNKFGSGSSVFATDEGYSYSMPNDFDENSGWDGTYNGQGLPKAWSAGAHFSDKWNEDKHHVNGNYQFRRRNIETVNNTLTQYTLPDSVYFNDVRSNSFSTSDKHGLSGLYEWNIDSLSSLRFSANGAKTVKRNTAETITDTKGSSGDMINNSLRRTANDIDGQNVEASLSWKKKFKKKGRSLIAETSFGQNHTNNTGFLVAGNSFYSEGVIDSVVQIDQQKNISTETQSANFNVAYTEPIAKKTFAEVHYRFNNQNNYSRQLSYNKDMFGVYQSLDSLFSSDYDFDISTHRAGANLRWVYDKLNVSFGADVANTQFVQTDNLFSNSARRYFNNFFPAATMNYKITKQSNVYFGYRGNTRQPSIEQIQPIRQNLDPLNISIGNPNLSQSFTNNFSFRYNSYQALKGTYYYASINMGFVSNDISRSEMISVSGIRTYQYVNVDGNFNSNAYAGAGFRIPKYDLNLNVNFSFSQNRINNLINTLKNKNDNYSYSLTFGLQYSKEKKIDISFNPSVNYIDNSSTINTQNTAFWTTTQSLDVLYYLPLKFQIGTTATWNVRQRTAAFDRNNNVFTLNAFVAKKFAKTEEFELRLSAFDIFNQNLGFSQYGYGNSVSQQSYNTIRRYVLLSGVWNFTRKAKDKSSPEEQQYLEAK